MATKPKQGVHRDVDRGSGELTLADEMRQPAFQFGRTEQVGAAMMKARQVSDEADVGVDSALGLACLCDARRQAVEREVLNELAS